MIFVLIFAEGGFERAVKQPSLECAEAFLDGVSLGAGLYAGDGCTGYIWPRDESDVRKYQKSFQVELAVGAIAKTNQAP